MEFLIVSLDASQDSEWVPQRRLQGDLLSDWTVARSVRSLLRAKPLKLLYNDDGSAKGACHVLSLLFLVVLFAIIVQK